MVKYTVFLVSLCFALLGVLGAAFRSPVAPRNASGRYLQIVAHSDDDLLFMNPDVENSIRAGQPTTTVYLTAGEANYNAGADDHGVVELSTCQAFGRLSREQYAGCRQQGIRAAYALMAGASANDWKRTQLRLDTASGPRVVEQDSLASVTLLFVDLPDAVDKAAGTDSLEKLELGSGESRTTIVPSGSIVRAPQTYDRETLLQTLTAILRHFDPTVVRVQESSPDDANHPRNVDHTDHIAAARLGTQALRRYGSARAVLVNYRDYNTNDEPVNLDPVQTEEKNRVFRAYADYDREIKADDLQYQRWPARLYQRWWGGTQWVARNLDGRLQAFAVLGHNLISWEQTVGGAWIRKNLGSPPGEGRLAPWVSVARNADGRLAVFVLQVDTPAADQRSERYRSDIYSKSQSAANGGWTEDWTPLGNPSDSAGPRGNLGAPSATTNQDGRLQIFVQNGGGGVSTKWQTAANGGWSEWLDLGGGPGVRDGLAATTSATGNIELFAYAVQDGVGSIKHWHQTAANGELTADVSFQVFEPAGPPTVAAHADGRLDVFYRLASSEASPRAAQVGHTWQAAASGGWTSETLDGHGGVGPIAAVSAPHARDGTTSIADARIILFQRNRAGGISMTRQTAANAGYEAAWVDTGRLVPHEPSAMADSSGKIFAFVLDGDGNLLVSAQLAANGGAPFSDWSVAGSL